MNTYERIFDDQAVAPTDNRPAPLQKIAEPFWTKASGYRFIFRLATITATSRPVPRFLPVLAGAVAIVGTAGPCTRVSVSSQSEEPMRKCLKQDQAQLLDKVLAPTCHQA